MLGQLYKTVCFSDLQTDYTNFNSCPMLIYLAKELYY